MIESFQELKREIQQDMESPEQMTNVVCNTIAYSIQNRKKRNEDRAVISDKHPRLNLMRRLDLIDTSYRALDVDNTGNIADKANPYLWRLSDKAIRLHRNLAYEGYYGGQE